MATYKLIQDIEAEDKILGPLTLRQFIFALIAVFFGYICFICIAKHVPFLLVLFLPPALFFGFFALPFGKDQPTEVWALAKLRFYFKPRKRIWNQSGMKELVTINVPKKVEHIYTDGLSQTQVKSRLQALANTIDSRGWATKNINVAGFAPKHLAPESSDRLLNIANFPVDVPVTDIPASDDMLDSDHNPIARQFDTMITQTSRERRQKLMDQMDDPTPVATPSDLAQNWFTGKTTPVPGEPAISQPIVATTVPAQAAMQNTSTTDDDEIEEMAVELKERAQAQDVAYENMRTLKPDTPVMQDPASYPLPEVTAQSDPAIISLAKRNDLNVATLGREANKAKRENHLSQDEVIISLH